MQHHEGRMTKSMGPYRKGRTITTNPEASSNPKGRGPVCVDPERFRAWQDAGVLAVAELEAEPEAEESDG